MKTKKPEEGYDYKRKFYWHRFEITSEAFKALFEIRRLSGISPTMVLGEKINCLIIDEKKRLEKRRNSQTFK